MHESTTARSVIARLAAKRLARVREPEVSAECVAMIEDAAPAVAALEADRLTRSTPARKAARSECDDCLATAITEQLPPAPSTLAADLTAQLKRLLTWQLREEPNITNDVPWIRLCEEVFAVLVCSLALVRGTTASPPDSCVDDGVLAEVAQAVADASETEVPAAATSTWHRWLRHMCSVAYGHTTARGLPAAERTATATETPAAALHRVKVRDYWPKALKAVVKGLEKDTALAFDIARQSKRCYVCGNVHSITRSWRGSGKRHMCTFPPHEFYEALGGEAFLIAYLAEKGAIEPSPKTPVEVSHPPPA